MGKKAKGSRKGKKAWRANISTEDIEDFFDKSTKDALSGGSLAAVPSESLFFVDKSQDLSVKKRIEKNRERVLRYDSILQKNQFVVPVPSSTQKKAKKIRKEVPKVVEIEQDRQKDEKVSPSGMADLWDVKDENNIKGKKAHQPSIIPAVEVEPSGCSFNPSHESHQDSLARAVADEMQKVYRDELGPKPVPLTVMRDAIDEDDMHFLDGGDGIDDDDETEDLDENGDKISDIRSKPKRVTRVEHNKRARRKGVLKEAADAKKAVGLSKQIDDLQDIILEIAEEDEEKNKRHIRRVVAKQDRLKVIPPRFGKFKFEPAPVQVLLSEDISGSLRKLKGCPTLARDRYKSLQKRGLVVPFTKISRRK